jgi:DNA-binding IclR family transcriptional regulator
VTLSSTPRKPAEPAQPTEAATSSKSSTSTKPTTSTSAAVQSPPHSQTLSRGIRVLEILAEAAEPMSIGELAAALEVHRSIAYRILRTLEDHSLVIRGAGGAVQLGPRMAALARGVARDLQTAALPELTTVANELGMTAFVAVLDRHEVVTLVSVEPRHARASVAQRPGTRHGLGAGAPGIAIQAGLTPAQCAEVNADEARQSEVRETLARGYALSHDEVIPGVSSVAVPLVVAGQPPAALAVVYVTNSQDVEGAGARLSAAAAAIVAEFS